MKNFTLFTLFIILFGVAFVSCKKEDPIAVCSSTLTGNYTWEGVNDGAVEWSEDVVLELTDYNHALVSIKNKSGVLQGVLRPNCEDHTIKFETAFSSGFFTTNPKYIEVEEFGTRHIFKAR